MITRRPQTLRAFTLIEMLAVCPLLALMLGLLAWTSVYHLKVSRGVASQSNRQETMYRILRSMRTDLLEADAVIVDNFDADTPVPAEVAELQGMPPESDQTHRTLATKIRTSRAAGGVRYFLITDSADVPRSKNSTLSDRPPGYILVRLDPADSPTSRIWPLRDLQVHISDDDTDTSTSVRVVFESRQDLDARVPIRRRFDTTLRTGGPR